MTHYAMIFALACFGLALLFNLWRVVKAPSIADRVLALDTMVINSIGALIVYGMLEGTAVYFEASMLIAMVGFVSTVAYGRFLLRGDIIE
jgi:multicomponent K+:H+ antiporter subunit F